MMEIDVVIIWVDGSDKEWLKTMSNYSASKVDVDDRAARYRDWGNLQYIFRGIEKYMPWVRKVHFVTEGHVPTWLNLEAPKLNFVKHSDYIPEKYLPTFSSHPIELNLHRIKGISNRFIYFNDDMFVVGAMQPNDFFSSSGLPLDMAVNTRLSSNNINDPIANIMLNNMAVLNEKFNMHKVVRKNWRKWLSLSYGASNLIRSLSHLPYSNFTCLVMPHLPTAFLKSTYEEVWRNFPKVLHNTSANKFRSKNDVSQYLLRGYQIAKGEFEPKNWYKKSRYLGVSTDNIDMIEKAIKSGKFEMLCLNDEAKDSDFEVLKNRLNKALGEILPEKSSFER